MKQIIAWSRSALALALIFYGNPVEASGSQPPSSKLRAYELQLQASIKDHLNNYEKKLQADAQARLKDYENKLQAAAQAKLKEHEKKLQAAAQAKLEDYEKRFRADAPPAPSSLPPAAPPPEAPPPAAPPPAAPPPVKPLVSPGGGALTLDLTKLKSAKDRKLLPAIEEKTPVGILSGALNKRRKAIDDKYKDENLDESENDEEWEETP